MGGAAEAAGGAITGGLDSATSGTWGKINNVATGGGLGALNSLIQGKGLDGMLANTPLGDLLGVKSGGGGGGSTTGPKPTMAAFKSALGPDGTLVSKYQVSPGSSVLPQSVKAGTVKAGQVKAGQLDTKALAADSRALNSMRERALGTGDSAWLKMGLDKQKLEEMSARDQAARQAMSGSALARSQLAMRGGLGGGASARIAMQAGRDMNAARQGIGRAGQLDRLSMRIADDQTKTGLLGQTAGLDLAHAGQRQDMSKFNIGTNLDASKFNVGANLDASKFNVGTALDASKTNAANRLTAGIHNDSQAYDANKTNVAGALGQLGGENQFNAYKYGEDMKGYAAGKQGDAIAGGGKK